MCETKDKLMGTIDVRELRIGSLVTSIGMEDNWSVVTSIKQAFNDEPYDIEARLSTGMFEEIQIEDLRPLILTEDWLVKFGGVRPDGLFYWLGDPGNAITIGVPHGGSFDFRADNSAMILKLDVKYVHQLQNLYFALTGKELEINN